MRARLVRSAVTFCMVLVVAFSLAAGVSGAGERSGSAPKLNVVLSEWVLKPAREFIAAGKTNFVFKNKGNEKHEVVIVRGDDAKDLPTKTDGSVDESKIKKSAQIGEVEGIKPGKTKSKVFNLKKGTYTLFCNIVDKEGDVHFHKGMHAIIDAS